MATHKYKVGTKVLFECGRSGKTHAKGVIYSHIKQGKYLYQIHIIEETKDVVSGEILQIEWICSEGAIIKSLGKPIDHLKAFKRAMQGI